MTFVLKLFFSGLMAFLPNSDGTEVTVVLLNVPHDYQLSDSSSLAHHTPLLLARGGSCSGDCPTRDADIAQFVYADQSESDALDSLEAAVSGGGAWDLTGADLSVQKSSSEAADLPSLVVNTSARGVVDGQPAIIPTTSAERADFSWLTSLHTLCPTCALNSDVLGSTPPAIVAARFHIRSGNVFTYRVARIGTNVTPAHFERLDSTGTASSYTQAITSWVGAELTITGTDIQIADDRLDGGTARSMTLTPDSDGKVEVAVLNLPPFTPPSSQTNDPGVGKHFEAYYELMDSPPSQATRLVPKPGAASGAPSYDTVAWSDIHPDTALYSDLLNALRLNIGRSVYDQTLCPPTTWP